MALIVGVHGIGQQLENEATLAVKWRPALLGSVRAAGVELAETDLVCASYGTQFRPKGRHLGSSGDAFGPDDLTDGDEELLRLWWEEAARTDEEVLEPEARDLGTSRTVQAALRALSGSRFFAGLAQRAMLSDLRQVRLYLTNDGIRQEARRAVEKVVTEDTRVVIGHSLGSVVAYEVLCANATWPDIAFVTIGSPLGISNLIFDQLDPPPASLPLEPRGAWPRCVRTWTNLSDEGDVVALVKDLRPLFGQQVENYLIDNGAHAHDVQPYLTALETGQAVASALKTRLA